MRGMKKACVCVYVLVRVRARTGRRTEVILLVVVMVVEREGGGDAGVCVLCVCVVCGEYVWGCVYLDTPAPYVINLEIANSFFVFLFHPQGRSDK